MTRRIIDEWIETAKSNGYKYIISVCDTFDWDDYPIYCRTLTELNEKYKTHDHVNMQKVNEIIRIMDDGTIIEGLSIHSKLI